MAIVNVIFDLPNIVLSMHSIQNQISSDCHPHLGANFQAAKTKQDCVLKVNLTRRPITRHAQIQMTGDLINNLQVPVIYTLAVAVVYCVN